MTKRSALTVLLACGLAAPLTAGPEADPTCDHACGHSALASAELTEAQLRAAKLIEAQTFFSLPESHREVIASKLEAMGRSVPTLGEDATAEQRQRFEPLSADELEAAWDKVQEYTTREAFESFAPVHQRMLANFTEVAPTHAVPVLPCFTPGTDPAIIEAFEAVVFGNAGNKFQQTNRWGGTALNPGGASQGDPTILTYSFPADGVNVPSGIGEGAAPNDLNSWLDGIYGNRATWRALYDQMFALWGDLSGNTYVLEPNDDNSELFNNPGIAGVRGDLRMAAKFLDGNSGTLAYNFFPQNGDMVLDSGDNFYDNLSGNSLRLRNILAHEHGHGMGQLHVCPLGDILMNPFINLAFDGPQMDDTLNAQRHYGDPLEPNDSIGAATDLGNIAQGGTVNVGGSGASNAARRDFMSVDDNSDSDFYRINVTSNGAIEAVVSPVGFTYLEGPQTGPCNTGSAFSPQSLGNLRLRIYNAGGQVLTTVNDTSNGSPETALANATPGVYYVEVDNTGQNTIQAYALDIEIIPPVELPLDFALDGAVPTLLTPGETTDFDATVFLNDDTISAGPSLHVRAAGEGSFTVFPMANNGGGSYTATIPAQLCGDDPDFFLSVTGDIAGLITLPDSGFFNARVGTGVIETDSGEGSIAFSVGGNVSTPEAGQWTNGTPQNNGRDDPETDADGNNLAWLTGQSTSTDNSDVDGGSTILTSPVYDFTDGGSVSFSYWMQDTVNPIGAEDGFTFEVSLNGGSTWTVARDFTTAGSWRDESIDIGSEFGNSSQFRFRFVATDNDPGDVLECGVDAIEVSAFECTDPEPECPFDLADTSGFGPPDGQVDFGDFFALSFLSGPCGGGTTNPDCTGDYADSSGFGPPDGQIDFGDFFALSFEAGPCP